MEELDYVIKSNTEDTENLNFTFLTSSMPVEALKAHLMITKTIKSLLQF